MEHFDVVFETNQCTVPVFGTFEVGTSPGCKGICHTHDKWNQDNYDEQDDRRNIQYLEPFLIIFLHVSLPSLPFVHAGFPV